MKDFIVTVVQTIKQETEVRVAAASVDDAIEKAMAAAEFDVPDSDSVTLDVYRVFELPK